MRTTDAYGSPDLGINASNEEYLERHPYASREYYSLCNFDMSEVEIVDQMELPGMSIGNNVDMNRANSIRSLMTKLKDTAQRTGCAIVLIGHLNKNNSGYGNVIINGIAMVILKNYYLILFSVALLLHFVQYNY